MHLYDVTRRKYFYVFSFLSIWVPASIRYAYKGDFSIYHQLFLERANKFFNPVYPPFEKGYEVLSDFIIGMGLPFSALIALVSFITYFVLFCSLPQKRKSMYLALYIGIFYLEHLQTIRVGLGLVFVILGIRLILKNKKKVSFLFVTGASLFHRSLILFVSIFILKPKKVKFWFVIVILIFVLFRMSSISIYFLRKAASFLPGHYAYYLYSKTTYIAREKNILTKLFGPGMILKNFILIVVYFKGSDMINKNKNNVYIISMSLIYLFFLLMNFEINILYRIKDIFAISLLFLYEEVGNLYFKENKKYEYIIIFIMYLIFMGNLKNVLMLGGSFIDTTILMSIPKW